MQVLARGVPERLERRLEPRHVPAVIGAEDVHERVGALPLVPVVGDVRAEVGRRAVRLLHRPVHLVAVLRRAEQREVLGARIPSSSASPCGCGTGRRARPSSTSAAGACRRRRAPSPRGTAGTGRPCPTRRAPSPRTSGRTRCRSRRDPRGSCRARARRRGRGRARASPPRARRGSGRRAPRGAPRRSSFTYSPG